MKHSISAKNFGVRLRPVRLDDAALIVELRNSPHAMKYIGDSAKTVTAQKKWLQDHFEQPDDYNFIIELSQRAKAVGMLGIYNIQGDSGEWGRWVIRPGVLAGPASAWLALHVCYEVLRLRNVCGLIVENNSQVLSFHRRAGYVDKGFHPVCRIIGGQSVRMVELVTTRAEWPGVSRTLEQFAVAAQKFLGS
jgi:RimJ/RimL family protein N-acetyltransferase